MDHAKTPAPEGQQLRTRKILSKPRKLDIAVAWSDFTRWVTSKTQRLNALSLRGLLRKNEGHGFKQPLKEPLQAWRKKHPFAFWLTVIIAAAVVATTFSLLFYYGVLALAPAASTLIGSGLLVSALFVLANTLGSAALLSSMRSLFWKSKASPKSKTHTTFNALWMGLRAALTVAMTLSWVPFILKGSLITHAGGSALFKMFNGLFHFGTAHTALQLFAMVGILAGSAFVIAALGKLISQLTANKLVTNDEESKARPGMAALHALGKVLSFGAMVTPFALMLSTGSLLPIIMPIVGVFVIGAAILRTVRTVRKEIAADSSIYPTINPAESDNESDGDDDEDLTPEQSKALERQQADEAAKAQHVTLVTAEFNKHFSGPKNTAQAENTTAEERQVAMRQIVDLCEWVNKQGVKLPVEQDSDDSKLIDAAYRFVDKANAAAAEREAAEREAAEREAAEREAAERAAALVNDSSSTVGLVVGAMGGTANHDATSLEEVVNDADNMSASVVPGAGDVNQQPEVDPLVITEEDSAGIDAMNASVVGNGN